MQRARRYAIPIMSVEWYPDRQTPLTSKLSFKSTSVAKLQTKLFKVVFLRFRQGICKKGVVVVYGLMYECIVVCMYKCVI